MFGIKSGLLDNMEGERTSNLKRQSKQQEQMLYLLNGLLHEAQETNRLLRMMGPLLEGRTQQ